MAKVELQDRGVRFLLITASVVLVVAGLRAISPFALPLLLAIFLSVLSVPLLKWLCDWRVPKAIAVVATVLANVSVMAVFLLLIGGSINAFAQSVPAYQQRIEAKAETVLDWLEKKGIDTSEYGWLRRETLSPEDLVSGPPPSGEAPTGLPDASPPERVEPSPGGFVNLRSVLDLLGSTVRGIASILGITLLVFLLMIFILLEASGLPAKLERAFGWRQEVMARFTSEVQRYLALKTLISLAKGILVGFAMWLVGVEYPLLWGLTAYVFNYIPNVGPAMASVPPVLLSLIDRGIGQALLVTLIFLAIHVTLGNFAEPHLMGRKFGISTLVVMLSLVFWGWLWGPVGMLISVPLTVIAKIILENTEDWRWVARLIEADRGSRQPAPGSLEMTEPEPTLVRSKG